MSFWKDIAGSMMAAEEADVCRNQMEQLQQQTIIPFEEFLRTTKRNKPENCRNCGSAHTRIKNDLTICAYCGSRFSS